ncbi:MAG: hypothetical protein FWG65_03230 [Turicibacter sp.]|nr:hypothetical protein [Turicibacter sp.]
MSYTSLTFLEMSAPHRRHSELVTEMLFELRDNFPNYKPFLKKEDAGLCYEPNPLECLAPTLIDITKIEDTKMLNSCSTFIPDILLFDKNEKMLSEDGFKIAGYPDLIIEVWSKWNDKKERWSKKYAYSTGKNTEHWYLTQNSNKIECWFEDEQLPNKSLKKVLVTQGGLKLDLRELAL